ncbi:MAG TPA: HPr family phosphocarrier protein [Pyrinomonadaceae bacterium]|jgi:phosphotransferase system HPr (HPr) family protein|nr:HPr family phosphocarrier protein [Pyrinomonadaceae bacterium]
MVEERVQVTNRLGLHARAAAQLVRTANGFQCMLRLERLDGSASADAKSILSVLMLAASRGTELRLAAEGADEREAANALCELFACGFGESEA